MAEAFLFFNYFPLPLEKATPNAFFWPLQSQNKPKSKPLFRFTLFPIHPEQRGDKGQFLSIWRLSTCPDEGNETEAGGYHATIVVPVLRCCPQRAKIPACPQPDLQANALHGLFCM